jgi:hypothetical protein
MMRRFTAEPTHHPIAWLLMPAGLLLIVSAFTLAEGSSSLVFLALGLAFAADGVAEVLPTRQGTAVVGLRIVSIAAFCVAFVTAVLRIASRLVYS